MGYVKKYSEKYLELKLRDEVKKRGGLCFKWTSPGQSGVPDRIVFAPDGTIHFVEVKSSGKKQSTGQVLFSRRIEKLGHTTHVIDDAEKLKAFLEFI